MPLQSGRRPSQRIRDAGGRRIRRANDEAHVVAVLLHVVHEPDAVRCVDRLRLDPCFLLELVEQSAQNVDPAIIVDALRLDSTGGDEFPGTRILRDVR